MSDGIIKFRRAVRSDAEAIAAIHDAAWRSTYQGLIPHLQLERMIVRRGPLWWSRQIERGTRLTLMEFDGTPQGYANWGEARGSWPWPAGEIFELYLAPPYQGVGLGRRLFANARGSLRSTGFNRLVVWALEDNEPACSFYGGLGGVIAAVAPERFGDVLLRRVAFVWGVNVKSSKA